jgi:outer membrane immunogenic protein
MKLRTQLATLAVVTAISGAAAAQGVVVTENTPLWSGFYAGLNAGAAINSTCNTWTANGPAADTAAFNNRDCPNKSTGIGGIQLGYNFQHEEWVWGFELDYDFWSSKSKTKTFNYTGTAFPPGVYSFSGKITPNGVAIIGPRVGYSIDNWLPYVRAGGVFTSGTHDLTATYTPEGSDTSTAVFNGGKNTGSHGFGISLGTEYKIATQWSAKFEYTYIKLSKSSQNSTTNCSPAGSAACDLFAGASLDAIHNSFTASLLRVGVNYAF